MNFKYFENADKFTGLKLDKTKCDICSETKYCFDAELFKRKEDFSSVCPECLKSGQLSNFSVTTCEGDILNLKKQIKELNPNLSGNDIDKIAKEKTNELETTTPNLVTWQDWFWPCADGDYCKFIGFGSKPLYKELAGDIEIQDFFKNSFYDKDSYTEFLWDDNIPVKAIKNYKDSNQFGTLFYVFKSLNSDKIITIWDRN